MRISSPSLQRFGIRVRTDPTSASQPIRSKALIPPKEWLCGAPHRSPQSKWSSPTWLEGKSKKQRKFSTFKQHWTASVRSWSCSVEQSTRGRSKMNSESKSNASSLTTRSSRKHWRTRLIWPITTKKLHTRPANRYKFCGKRTSNTPNSPRSWGSCWATWSKRCKPCSRSSRSKLWSWRAESIALFYKRPWVVSGRNSGRWWSASSTASATTSGTALGSSPRSSAPATGWCPSC